MEWVKSSDVLLTLKMQICNGRVPLSRSNLRDSTNPLTAFSDSLCKNLRLRLPAKLSHKHILAQPKVPLKHSKFAEGEFLHNDLDRQAND